jgi:hypothetical protein
MRLVRRNEKPAAARGAHGYNRVVRYWLLLVLAACAADDPVLPLRFTPDPGPPGSERYLCFGFDVSALAGADLGAIRYVAAESPVLLHHVTLYASPAPFPDGPVDCLEMPTDAVSMNVWAPGGGDVVLAGDTSLVIPDGTQRLIVQTHALRMADGTAPEREIVLTSRAPAEHRAGWLPIRLPVPVIQPGQRTQVIQTCTFDSALHLVSTWPHMHQIGAEFHGALVRGDATEPLVDVVPWDFDMQRAYPLDVELAAGDAISTQCIWQNSTSAPVLPGPRIGDEMCNQSLIAYPYDAAHCVPSAP